MRRAPAMPLFRKQSAAEQTSLAPHDSKARLQDVTTRRRFMAKPCTPHPIPQAEQLFEIETANVGGRGVLPSPFSGGFKGGILFGKRIPPLVPRRARRPPSRAVRGKLPHPLANQKSATFLKNPLDKWAPRAIMQSTSKELQTYDGEK